MVTLLTKTCSLTFTAYQGVIHKKISRGIHHVIRLNSRVATSKKNFEDKILDFENSSNLLTPYFHCVNITYYNTY